MATPAAAAINPDPATTCPAAFELWDAALPVDVGVEVEVEVVPVVVAETLPLLPLLPDAVAVALAKMSDEMVTL